MNPLQILANIGLTLADLNLETVALRTLQQAAGQWTSWTQAQATAKLLGFPAGPQGAIKAFNIGRLLANQSMWVPAVADVLSIPRQMMALASPTEWSGQASAKYRYDVKVDVHFTRSGDLQRMFAHVESTTPLSEAEVIRRAQAAIRGDLLGASPKLLADEGPLFEFGSMEIDRVFRYV